MTQSKLEGNPSHDITSELLAIKFVTESSSFGYFLKRYVAFLPQDIYGDHNLFAALDYAIQTKQYDFVDALYQRTLIEYEKNRAITKKDFAEILLHVFFDHVKKAGKDPSNNSVRLIKKYLNRYFISHELGIYISKKTISDENKDYDVFLKTKNTSHNLKCWYSIAALLLALFVSLPEGALAVYAGSGSIITLTSIIGIGFPVVIISYFLYRRDIYDYLKDSDKDNDLKTSLLEKIFIYFLLGFASLALGILYYKSVLVTLGEAIYGLTSLAAVLGSFIPSLIIISSFFGIAVAVANFALFKKTAFNIYLSFKDYTLNFISKLKKQSWPSLFFLTLSITTAALMQVWFYVEFYSLLQVAFGISTFYTTPITAIITVFSCLNGLFYGEKLYNGLDGILNYISSWFSKERSSTAEKNELENKRFVLDFVYKGIFFALFVGCLINAANVAFGVSAIVASAGIVYRCIVYILSGSASLFANASASYNECALPSDSIKCAASDEPDGSIDIEASINTERSRYQCFLFESSKMKDILSSLSEDTELRDNLRLVM